MRVRTALKLGMDRDIIVNKVKAQGDMPAYGYTPPYTDGAKLTQPEWFGWSQEKRNEEAKKLLAEAGYTADKPLTINLLYNTSDTFTTVRLTTNVPRHVSTPAIRHSMSLS